MIERVKDVLAEKSAYTLDLYRTLKPEMNVDAFQSMLNIHLEKGDLECVDGVWRLSHDKHPIVDAIDAMNVSVYYLINKSHQFKHSSEKQIAKLKEAGYFRADKYELQVSKFSSMVADYLNGYQIVPGQFSRNEDGKIRRKECWRGQQVFMLEFDDDVKEIDIETVIANNDFIRNNAAAVLESIRSRYDDPKDKTCNGELRYRILFVTPAPLVKIEHAEFFTKWLLSLFPNACPSGSNITNGAIGCQGKHHIFLNNYLSTEACASFKNAWRAEQAKRKRYRSVPSEDISEIPSGYQKMLGDTEFSSDGWSKKMYPCVFQQHEHDGWNSHRNAMSIFKHTDGKGYTFRCFKCEGKRSFRIKSRKSGRNRVKKTDDSDESYASLEDAEQDTKKVWDLITRQPVYRSDRRRAILVQSDTGVGKDFAMLAEAKNTDIMSLNPHSGLSAQLHDRAEKAGLYSYHIRSRMAGWEKIDGKPLQERIRIFKEDQNIMCIHADRCEALLLRTGNCKDVLCNEHDCEVYDFCKRNRYVSQLRKAAAAKIAHYSWVQLPTDPASQGIVAQINGERRRIFKDKPVWVVGEVDALKLLNFHRISTQEIEKGIETWGDEPAGQFYRLLSRLCQIHLTGKERYEMLLKGFAQVDKSDTTRQLSRIGRLSQGYTDELSVTQAVRDKFISIENVGSIRQIPKTYQKHWTLVQQVDAFLSFATGAEPPIFFDSQTLYFCTPPQLHNLCDTYVMQSATADKTQIESLITAASVEIDFYASDGSRVEHHQGTRIFKVATGRYVRSTCFEYDSDWNIVGLRESIRPHLETLLGILMNTPGKKFVNTYKAIYEGHELEDDALIELIRNAPNTQFSNWAAGFGIDLDSSTVMVEFGTNEPSLDVLKNACNQVYMTDKVPLSYEYTNTYKHNGIEIEGVRTYIDERVQAQYEQMTSLAQYQMANRTRPVRNPSTVLIYSSHPCRYLDNRVQWILPNMLGGDLRKLDIGYENMSDFQKDKEQKKEIAVSLAKEGYRNADIATQLGYKSEKSVRDLLKGLEL